MAAVYVNNLVINSGSDFTQVFTLQGSDTNSSFDLSNFTAESKMRKWSGSTSSVEFDIEIYEPKTLGKIELSLPSIQTSSIKPGRYIYDVVIIDNYGIRNRVIEGMVIVREGATY